MNCCHKRKIKKKLSSLRKKKLLSKGGRGISCVQPKQGIEGKVQKRERGVCSFSRTAIGQGRGEWAQGTSNCSSWKRGDRRGRTSFNGERVTWYREGSQ